MVAAYNASRRFGRKRPWTRRRRSYQRNGYKRRRLMPRSMALRNTNMVIPRSLGQFGLKNRQKFKLTYSHTSVLNRDDLAGARNAFRLNSLYDPLYDLGGAQPPGFDQWKAFYLRYMVTGCRVTVTWQQKNVDSVSHNSEDYLGIWLSVAYNSSDDVSLKTLDQIVCNPFSAYAAISGPQGNLATSRVSKYFDMKMLKGNNLDQDDGALVSTNPSNSRLAVVQIAEPNAVEPCDIYGTLHVRLDYHGYFYQPKNTLADTIS